MNQEENLSPFQSELIKTGFFPRTKEGWDLIFNESLRIKDKDLPEKEKFRENLIKVINKFPCGTCAKYAREFIGKHDIKKYYELKETIEGRLINIGLFKYIWEFKNDVNRRANKPQITLVEAYKLYN
jgi:hypothetical protein